MRLKSVAVLAISAIGGMLGLSAGARANLVLNGGFERVTNGPGQLVFSTDAEDWSSPDYSFDPSRGYNFVLSPSTMDTSPGAPGAYGGFTLWGPGTGSNNGLTPSPDGGNFLAADGDPLYRGRVEQTINGLVAGQTYEIGFWWAGAQQSGASGETTSQWEVAFAGQTKSTSVVANPSEGFTGWMYQSFLYTARNASEVLSFLANGSPSGAPPFMLLDGVSVSAKAVPEPSTLLLAGVSVTLLAVVHFRRRHRVRSSNS